MHLNTLIAFYLLLFSPLVARSQVEVLYNQKTHFTYGEPNIRFVEKEPLPVQSENSTLSPRFWAQLGLGITQARYAQSLPQFMDLSFSDNSQGPTLQLQAGGWLHYNWGIEAYYKNNPAEITGSSSLIVQNGKYNVQSVGIEALWRKYPLLLEQKSETFFKVGIHQHDLPFLIALTPLIISRELNSVRTLSFAAETHCAVNSQWRVETWLRYQHPFTAGSENGGNLDITPNFTIDGSVGALYRFPNFTTIGFFWTGEWHDYNYKYVNDSLNLNFSGYQNLFQSTFDLKMGVEF